MNNLVGQELKLNVSASSKNDGFKAALLLSPDPKRIGGYSDQPGVRPSVRLSVCPSVRPSVRP